MENQVGLFFYVNGRFLFRGIDLDMAEDYGEYLTYQESHYDIWEKYYEYRYQVDFDYYPRGRVVYKKTEDTYIIYYDQCIETEIVKMKSLYAGKKIMLELDEHYQCHMCNEFYVV